VDLTAATPKVVDKSLRVEARHRNLQAIRRRRKSKARNKKKKKKKIQKSGLQKKNTKT